jgi:4-hydroxyphenylpyruvate dioxygenase
MGQAPTAAPAAPDTTAPERAGAPGTTRDGMPLLGIDHIELYVGDTVKSAHYMTRALGFRETAVAGLESGVRDRASRVLEQGRIRFVVTAALGADSDIARHVREHGDGVKVVAMRVPDAEHAYREAVRRGARGVREPREASDDRGTVRLATIATYGETLHTFVERDRYQGAFLPGYVPAENAADDSLLVDIDHVVGNVELGRLDEWVSYYERVFGFTEMIHFSDEDISTEYSALMSKVMADGQGRIKFPINEPAEGQRKSQIEEYLEYYGGAGVQHIALSTRDIVRTVAELRDRGVRFLTTPGSYYEELPARVGEIDEDLGDLREVGVLADRDDEGYLLQIFTKPLSDRPTLFLELIERHGARGFGEGNFKALFEAIERDQAKRGNL